MQSTKVFYPVENGIDVSLGENGLSGCGPTQQRLLVVLCVCVCVCVCVIIYKLARSFSASILKESHTLVQ